MSENKTKMTLNSSLLQWLSTFQLDNQPSIDLKDDAYYNLADGYVCARILNQISPQYFSDKWLDGIKPVAPNGSWRLRVSNLKRILQKIHDYTSDLQSTQFKPDAITPDVAVIAQNFDPDQISKLIQLLLFCSINCDKKEYYIERIHQLPYHVKEDIKAAIEELLIQDSTNHPKELNTSQPGNHSIFSESGPVFSATTSSPASHNHSNHSAFAASSNNPQLRTSTSRSVLRRDSSQSSYDKSKQNETESDLFHNTGGEPRDTVEEIKQRLHAALKSKDEKAQACFELELKLKELQLALENERLTNSQAVKLSTSTRNRLEGSMNPDSGSQARFTDGTNASFKIANDGDDSDNLAIRQNMRLHGEVHRLKEDLIKVETEKEDFRLKVNLLKEDLDRLTLRHNELKDKAELAKRLQDELDEQRHITEKVTNYEAMVANLMKKNNDLKREIKNIEEKNTVNIQRVVQLEEENSQLSSTLVGVDIYKKKLQESQVQLSQETHRADKAEVELSRLAEKYSIVLKDNEKLHETTSQLLRQSFETRASEPSTSTSIVKVSNPNFEVVNLKSTSPERLVQGQLGLVNLDGSAQENIDLMSKVDLKEKIARLEYEKELLQNKSTTRRESDNSVLAGLLESANSRCTKLEVDNRQLRKKTMLLEAKVNDLTQMANISTACSNSENIAPLMNRVEELQRLLLQKEHELTESEAKYKRNLHKAKELIKQLNNNQSITNSLHPSFMSSASSFNSSSLDETNLLKQQLKDREDRIIDLERDFYEFKKFKEIHERLIISAFYGLTTPMQWKNAEKRLERSTITSPPNTANPSISHHSKHSH